MGGITQGFGQMGRQISENTRLSERLNNQWRALGTTIRYAIAGTAVFGLTRMVGQLKEVQTQMGLISAIGTIPGPGGIAQNIQGQNLTKLMDDARLGAMQSLTPVTDYNDAMINLLSTLQNVPRDQITPIVTQISQAAQLAQVSAEDATKAFTTMNVAFGQKANLSNIRRMAQEFFILTQEAPGGKVAGQELITQFGQLAQVTRAAHGRPQDMFALLLSVLRSGIPPQQTGRGLQYLLQTVAFPAQQTKASREALQSVGITTTSDMNLQQRLSAIFGRARQLGVRGSFSRLKNLDEESLANMEAMPPGQALASVGITGRGAAFLGTIFRRIHALRTALAISGQLDVGQAQADLKTMDDSWNGHVKDVNDLAKAWQRFRKQAKLQDAVVSLNALGLQVAQAFAPVLNVAATGISGAARVAAHHPQATQWAARGLGAGAAALLIARFLGVGTMGPFKRLGPISRLLGGGVGTGFVAERAAESVIKGGGQLGASMNNPLYVIVVGQLFGGAAFGGGTSTGGFGSRTPGGGAGGAAGTAERVAEDYLGFRILKKGGGFLKTFGRRAWGLEPAIEGAGLKAGVGRILPRVIAGPEAWMAQAVMLLGGGGTDANLLNLRRAQRVFPQGKSVTGVDLSHAGIGKFHGTASVWMTIDVNQGGRITRKRVHVPLEMWAHGRSPSRGGKPKTQRVN